MTAASTRSSRCDSSPTSPWTAVTSGLSLMPKGDGTSRRQSTSRCETVRPVRFTVRLRSEVALMGCGVEVSGSQIDSAAAVLEELDQRGLGHWELRPPPEIDLTSHPRVRVHLPDGTTIGVLQCSTVVDLSDSQVAEVEDVAALIGSVLDAERRASDARRRAAQAEAESVT